MVVCIHRDNSVKKKKVFVITSINEFWEIRY